MSSPFPNSLGQVSEFGLIIVTQGLILGHISSEIFSLIVILATITITTSTYFIKFENMMYEKIQNVLTPFEITLKTDHLKYLPEESHNIEYDVILLGYDRVGYSIFKTLKDSKKSFIVVDFNPDVIKRLAKRKIHCMYGDIGDTEILDRINFKKAHLIISTISDSHDNKLILKSVRKVNKKAPIFVTALVVKEALDLYDLGADYVILPHYLGGDYVAGLLHDFAYDLKTITKSKLHHIDELKKQLDLGL